MVRHLSSKIALGLYFVIAAGLFFWAYNIYVDRNKMIPAADTTQSSDKSENINLIPGSNEQTDAGSNSSITETETSDIQDSSPIVSRNDDVQKISTELDITGPMIAHITQEHCNNNCQAFASDLGLFEYCEQSCGITPIKNVSDCDDKKDIQKDYCQKDLAIIKKELSLCDKINDANIKQSCRNHIEQAAIEEIRRNRPSEEPTF